MNLIITPAYKFSNQEIDCMYALQKVYTSAGYTFYRWPEIYYGEHYGFVKNIPRKRKIGVREEPHDLDVNLYDIDYLGAYIYPLDKNGESFKEGRIEIYKDRIEECVRRITHDPSEIVKMEINLRLIVLLHELGHWFTHWCHKENQLQNALIFSKQQTAVKETLAQLSVLWGIKTLKSPFKDFVTDLFYYLVNRQPSPYRKFLLIRNRINYTKTINNRYRFLLDNYPDDWNTPDGLNYFLYGFLGPKNAIDPFPNF